MDGRQAASYNKRVRFIIYFIASVLVILIAFYIAPPDVKEKAAASIEALDFLPESVKEKAEALLLTPPQRRIRLIQKLEENLGSLKSIVQRQIDQGTAALGTVVDDPLVLVENAEKIIEKIKKTNQDPGVINTAASKVIEELKDEVKKIISSEKENSTPQNQPDCVPQLDT